MDFRRAVQHNCRQWIALTGRERIVLIQAMILLPVARMGRWVRIREFQRILGRLLLFPGERKSSGGTVMETARRVSRMVAIAAGRTSFRPSCLERSLVLWALLGRHGIDGELHLGVSKDNGDFEAHAWVELNGTVLNDTDDVRERFAPFPVPIKPIKAVN